MRGILALAAAICMQSATAALAAGEKPLFATTEPIQITIQAPIERLVRNRSIDTALPGTLTGPDGQALPISVALRGHVNRLAETCEFPPLRVDFTAPPPPTSVFAGQKSLKLMTHCKNAASDQQYVLLDYAAYRMYSLLTPHSFRARLLNVDYRDETGRPIVSRVAFFLEDLKDVAKRNGLKQVRAGTMIPLEWLSAGDAARAALFEHMIANHDWSMRAGPAGENCCHNFKLLGVGAPGQTIPVPYDFDFSGLVDEPYALPPGELQIDSVRERRYRGYCAHNADVIAAARQIRDERPQLIAEISSTPGLDPHAASRAISFLDGFFADIASDDTVTAKVLKRCVN